MRTQSISTKKKCFEAINQFRGDHESPAALHPSGRLPPEVKDSFLRLVAIFKIMVLRRSCLLLLCWLLLGQAEEESKESIDEYIDLDDLPDTAADEESGVVSDAGGSHASTSIDTRQHHTHGLNKLLVGLPRSGRTAARTTQLLQQLTAQYTSSGMQNDTEHVILLHQWCVNLRIQTSCLKRRLCQVCRSFHDRRC